MDNQHISHLLQTTIATESSFLPINYKPHTEKITVTEIKPDSHILVPTIAVKNRIEETKREHANKLIISPRNIDLQEDISKTLPEQTRERRISFDKLVEHLHKPES